MNEIVYAFFGLGTFAMLFGFFLVSVANASNKSAHREFESGQLKRFYSLKCLERYMLRTLRAMKVGLFSMLFGFILCVCCIILNHELLNVAAVGVIGMGLCSWYCDRRHIQRPG